MKVRRPVAVGWILLAMAGLPFLGCTTMASGLRDEKAQETPAALGGAQLWSRNCMKCHLMRSPSEYNDVQTDIMVHHMRVRAYLTAEEAGAIAEFLKAAN